MDVNIGPIVFDEEGPAVGPIVYGPWPLAWCERCQRHHMVGEPAYSKIGRMIRDSAGLLADAADAIDAEALRLYQNPDDGKVRRP